MRLVAAKPICFFFLLFVLCNLPICSTAQQKQDTSSYDKTRLITVVAGSTAIYAGSLVGLNELWYKGYPRSNFHFFNDNDEWLQFDKLGHSFSAYYESLIGIQGLKWTGIANKKAIFYGGLFGFIFQLPIEIMDGYSSAWGASWGDLTANTLGAGLALGQFMAWDEQKILFRYSFFPTEISKARPDLLGNNMLEQLIKDYNGITLWLSAPISDLFSPGTKFPGWLYISFGYGANNMYGVTFEKTPADYLIYKPYRQYYLSCDINPLRIKTKNKYLKALLIATSFIKVPAPALEITSQGKFLFHPIYF